MQTHPTAPEPFPASQPSRLPPTRVVDPDVARRVNPDNILVKPMIYNPVKIPNLPPTRGADPDSDSARQIGSGYGISQEIGSGTDLVTPTFIMPLKSNLSTKVMPNQNIFGSNLVP